MLSGLWACWQGLRHLNHRGYIYVWANLAWVALSLPLVTAPAAWAGLIRMSHTAYREPTADIRDFWEGFKENFGRGALLALLNAVVIGINVTNLIGYSGQVSVGVSALRVVWLLTLLVWFTLQFYAWVLYYEMKQPTLLRAFRNAAVMLYLNPLFTLGMWVGIAIILAVSTVLTVFWLLLTGSALAAVANSVVLNRLEAGGFVQLPKRDFSELSE